MQGKHSSGSVCAPNMGGGNTMPYTQQDLDLAQRHVDEAARQAHHHRYLLDKLSRAGHNPSAAEELLHILETAHRDLTELRNKIAAALARPEYWNQR